MLNYIWMALMAVSIIVGAINGKLKEVTEAMIESAGFSVELAIGLIGVMAFWLGLMKIGEKAGLIQALARLLHPIMKWIFPDIPKGHPALGSIVMNFSANFLGLGNAATPLGLKAMQELQEINPQKDTASNAMVSFLAMNTACPVLIPASIIAIRTAAGSQNPTAIIFTTLIASMTACTAALISSRVLQKLPIFKIKTKDTANV